MRIREMLKLLEADGWKIKNQEGSHIQLIHKTKKGKVTIPNHSGDIKKKTAETILKQAGLK